MAVVITTNQPALTVIVMVTVSLTFSAGSEHGAALGPRNLRPRDTVRGGGHWDCGPLTAVIFRMVIFSKLETVVTSTNQVSFTASVSIMLTSITRSVTVSLSLVTGLLRGAASPPIVVSPGTPLTWPGLGRDTGDSDDEGQEEKQPGTELNFPEHLSGQF